MKPLSFVPAILFLVTSIFLLCLPGSGMPGGWFFVHIPQFDKLVHIGMFGLLCLLFHLPANRSSLVNRRRKRWFWCISLLAIAYGVGMEFVQKELVINRSFEMGDIVADSIGSLLALGWAYLFFLQKGALRMHVANHDD